MRPLVLCYSLTGLTAAVARELALQLDAEFAQIGCRRYEGFVGPFRALVDVIFDRTPAITLPETSMSASRQIIIAGPIWADRACGPVRAALDGRLRPCYDLMLLLSHGRGTGPGIAQDAIADARLVFGSPFQAYASVSRAEMERSERRATAQRLARLFRAIQP